jgi:hypothetical protein
VLVFVAALAIGVGAARAAHAADTRELKAREDFAAGRYQQALDLFAKLYAETLHPVYLRNIGRCYQNLGDADKALISFRDYLRKHKTITAEERKEVEGFIAEMEDLKRRKEGEAPPRAETSPSPSPQPSPQPPASTIAPLPSAAPESVGGETPAALVAAPVQPAAESPPVYTRWWFWTIVGAAVVGAGVGIAAATGAFTTTKDGDCLDGYTCR